MRTLKQILGSCLALVFLFSGCAAPMESGLTASAQTQVILDNGEPIPEREPVDDSWFDQTAMIGHSLMRGMELYSGLDAPDYYTLTGGSVNQILSSDEVTMPSGGTGRLAAALEDKSYERFYLFMGINEIANELDELKSDYLRLLELVRSNSPDAEVYVLAVMPVTRSKASGGTFTLERITAYNEMLQALCEEQDCWYVDLYTCFSDEDGYLPDSASSDGVHLKQEEYAVLLEYLKTHTAD